jgi:hypothetical protein
MSTQEYTPSYERWRHGGWYTNNRHPLGGCGTVSRNYPDRKWRIVGEEDSGITYANRDAAARAEHDLFARLDAKICPEPVLPGNGSGMTWPDGSVAWRCKLPVGHDGPHA